MQKLFADGRVLLKLFVIAVMIGIRSATSKQQLCFLLFPALASMPLTLRLHSGCHLGVIQRYTAGTPVCVLTVLTERQSS